MSATTEKIKVSPDGHSVYFYRDDGHLAETVCAYLADALAEGATAVVIATEPHLRVFAAGLAGSELDLEAARASCRLIVLDASETLARLTVDGRISRCAFQDVVGRVMRSAARGGEPVRAYGEIVDLLWQDGDISDALELEGLWNELIEELRFSLLCAYESARVSGPEHEHALRKVCQLHSSVTAAPASVSETYEVSREFAPDAEAPSSARYFVAETLRDWGQSGTQVDNGRLLVSELVTNAVIHARSRLSVSIQVEQSRVRLCVHDMSQTEPTLRSETTSDSAGGRGLQIVSALSNRWGVETTAIGKTVWAEF